MSYEPARVYERIQGGEPPLVLDVRHEEDFERWRVEGRLPVETMSLPYSEFLEFEEECVERVKTWIAGRDLDVLVVCAKGDASDVVAKILRARGIDAGALEGGMAAWGLATQFVAVPAEGPLNVWQGVRFGKGCYSYVLASGPEAVIVDPHRDVACYRRFLGDHGLLLRAVFDTHLHADHLSGGLRLAESPNVPYHVHALDFQDARMPYSAVWDGFLFRLGQVLLEVRHAPGHTPGSILLLVGDSHVISGDTLFASDVGRPDLASLTSEWGRELHRTLTERIARLEDRRVVLPAHAVDVRSPGFARLSDLRASVPAFRMEREEFVRALEATTLTASHEHSRVRLANLGLIHPYEEERASLEFGRNEGALCGRTP